MNTRTDANKTISAIDEIKMIEKFLDPISGYNYPSFNDERMDLIPLENFLFLANKKIHGSLHSFKQD